jgi:TonB family protein
MTTAAIRHDSDWVGQVVDGRFSLLRWLGNSGQGDVFLTELPGHLPQKAAIKLIPANGAYSESQMAGWTATQRLSHPHLMRLFHVGSCQINGTPLLYAVMEYAEEDLSQILPERPLTPTETREMLDPLLDALSYVHGQGLAHGHLKPSNIMAVNDQLKLSCDGIQVAGRGVKSPSPLTVYDAPERATQGLSPAADVWALGVTLVEALTQHAPVWDRSKQKVPLVPESMPPPFGDIAKECLRTDPALRCTLGDIKARLNPAAPVVKISSETPKPAKAEPAKSRMTAIVAAMIILFAVIAFLFMRSREASPSPATETQQTQPATETTPSQSPLPESPSSTAAVKGAVASQVLPEVPPNASSTIHGTVKVKVKAAVDPSGSVSDATLESAGPSRYFSGLALQAARQWKFKPPQVNGKPVSSTWILQFEYQQTATTANAVETLP